ncbi:MAG: isoprenyl transferase [Candidatus Omnitrophica bacterium]|nr:isoprenyl transferase [Candidatus Omnitrophota bacterium]
MSENTGIPKHIAIIMDGNGRWAKERGLPRTAGHKVGIDRVKEIVSACADEGIGVLTLFAFSTENWSRPKREVRILMRYFDSSLKAQIEKLHKNNIRFKAIGKKEELPEHLRKRIHICEERTKDNTGLVLVLALNYGSRQEILAAVRKLAQDIKSASLKPEDLDERIFGSYLYTEGLPDPDLLIRTSGEMRISNFLLWQLSYAELYFVKKCWPDFRKADLLEAIAEYEKRQRRFGAVA